MSRLQKIEKRYLSLAFGVLENNRNKNKRTKKILENIFNRNLELNVYNGYGEIKRKYSSWKEQEISRVNDSVLGAIQETNKQTKIEEDTIKMLEGRLEDKSQSIFMRKVLACRKFYLKNYTQKTLHFLNKWRNKVAYEAKIKKFAGILERKTRILIKNKFVLNFFRNEKDKEYQELKKRLSTFKSQL